MQRELRERLLLQAGRGMKTCTFLHFWEQVKAKTTEEESQQRGRCTSPASIMESLRCTDEPLPGDPRRQGVDSFSGLFVRRGDCLFGPQPLARGRMTSLSFLLTACRGVWRPWRSTLRKHYFSAPESLIMRYKCRNSELSYSQPRRHKQDRAEIGRAHV